MEQIAFLNNEEVGISLSKMRGYLLEQEQLLKELQKLFSQLNSAYQSDEMKKLIKDNEKILSSMLNNYQNQIQYCRIIEKNRKAVEDVKRGNIQRMKSAESEFKDK